MNTNVKNADMILDQVDVIKLDISIWTSSKKLRPEDLVLADGSKLPPEDLASLGTKKTINPEKLKEFNRIKKEAERICLTSGTRFIGGFANPRVEIPCITKELDALSVKFYKERDLFLASYTADTEAWIRAHPEFGEAIRRAIEPVGTVKAKLRFDYVVFRVSKPEQAESLDRRALSMSEQLFKEIAQDASQIIDRAFLGKDSVSVRALNGFRKIRDKLDSLGFLDHRCMPVVDEIDSVLKLLPDKGPYNGIVFNNLFKLGMLLSDADKIQRYGSGLLAPIDVDFEDESDEEIDALFAQDVNSEIIEEETVVLPIDVTNVAPADIDASTVDVNSDVQPEILSKADEDDFDDLPGLDDFFAKYNSTVDVATTDIKVIPSDVSAPVVETAAVNVEATLDTVSSAVEMTVVNVSAGIESIFADDDLPESCELVIPKKPPQAVKVQESTTDFWF